MPYAVDDSVFSACCAGFSQWAQSMVRGKIETIKNLENPRAAGGKHGGKWAYPVGKFHIICRIDDDKKLITILSIVSIA